VEPSADATRLPTLRTRRLVLEPITEVHATRLLALVSDDRLYEYQPHWLPKSLEELRERFAIYSTGRSRDGRYRQLNWVVRRNDDGADVGMVQCTFLEEPKIGYQIFVPYWKMGYGKEAVAAALVSLKHRYAANKVMTSVDVDNVASIALLESLGFTRTGPAPAEKPEDRPGYRYERVLDDV
jgi:ribosomal-protein-alanine N-acetyltransferase